MARVTVEDCILKVPNRFELVMAASQRAREIGSGSALLVERDNDKNPVVSLREIADTDLSVEDLKESLIKNHQKVIEMDDENEEIIDMMEGEEQEWANVTEHSNEVESHTKAAGMHEENLNVEAEQVGMEELLATDAPAPATEESSNEEPTSI